jgi:hypothetical protein
LGLDWDELFKFKVDKNSPLPGGDSVDKLVEEEDKL